jgi:hypothetical protein
MIVMEKKILADNFETKLNLIFSTTENTFKLLISQNFQVLKHTSMLLMVKKLCLSSIQM